MENRVFTYSLIVSLLIHLVIFGKLSYSNVRSFKRILKSVEVTYVKSNPKIPQQTLLKNQPAPTHLEKRTEVRLKDPSENKSFVKSISKLLKKIELPKKEPATVEETMPKRQITVPPLKSEKINNPNYLNYYQIVRTKIRDQAYQNYSQYDTGEVYLTFAISSDGTLQQIKFIEERTDANQYLRMVSKKSVEDANPFPPFPNSLKFPELTFNVVISFKEVE